MFNRSAKLYDAIYRFEKNYEEESDKLAYLLNKLGLVPQKLLDVACGSGEHAYQLRMRHNFSVDGLDIEPDFINIARRKNPNNKFTINDMSDFSLEDNYDVIMNLFSSIGYVQTIEKLQQAIACMGRHLTPNGYLILEPWIEPTNDLSMLNTIIDSQDPTTGFQIKRTRTVQVENNISILNIEYSIDDGIKTSHFTEEHRLGMFTREQIGTAFKQAGFTFTYAEQGLHNKGIYLAKRSSLER